MSKYLLQTELIYWLLCFKFHNTYILLSKYANKNYLVGCAKPTRFLKKASNILILIENVQLLFQFSYRTILNLHREYPPKNHKYEGQRFHSLQYHYSSGNVIKLNKPILQKTDFVRKSKAMESTFLFQKFLSAKLLKQLVPVLIKQSVLIL